jgi:2-polyprenyl-6-methoxyphenol hydroxylase-like FAD-dependent oxidoreductase
MSRTREVDVLIAGAGPVGLFTAISLARRGVDVAIFEQSFRTTTRSYALALHPATLALLDDVDLGRAVFAKGREVRRMAFYEGDVRHVDVRFDDLQDGYPCLVLPQADLESILEDELATLGVRVHWNHRVSRVTPDPTDRARVTVAKLGEETLGYAVSGTVGIVKQEIPFGARVVLGMDGHRSVVRQNLFIDFPQVNDAELFAVFETHLTKRIPGEACVAFADDLASLVWPMVGEGCRFAFQVTETGEPVKPRLKSRRVVQFRDHFFRAIPKEQLGELTRERLPWFDGTVRDTGWSALIRFERRLAASFGRDNVWMAGDAVHLASPVSGLSMNIGMLEGDELARIATSVVKERGAMNQFDAYGERRLAEWRHLLAPDAHVRSTDGCDSWTAANAVRIANCLPASGAARVRLGDSIGLEIAAPDPMPA